MLFFRTFFLAFFLLFSGCKKYGLDIVKIKVSKKSLPSTFVKSIDPAQSFPPYGEKLYIGWNLSPSQDLSKSSLKVFLIFKNLTQEELTYYPKDFYGFQVYELVGEKFKEKQGLLTYKAELYLENKVLTSYVQNVWFDLLLKKTFSQKDHTPQE